jgi:hypothetical protein
MGDDGLHPYFNDRRTVRWHASLESALAAAQESGKRVFVQYGRQSCGGSRALVEKTILKDEIGEFLRDNYECFAVDADHAPEEISAILATLPKREPTPVCIYLASDARVVFSTAGGRPAAVFLNDMVEAKGKK